MESSFDEIETNEVPILLRLSKPVPIDQQKEAISKLQTVSVNEVVRDNGHLASIVYRNLMSNSSNTKKVET